MGAAAWTDLRGDGAGLEMKKPGANAQGYFEADCLQKEYSTPAPNDSL